MINQSPVQARNQDQKAIDKLIDKQSIGSSYNKVRETAGELEHACPPKFLVVECDQVCGPKKGRS